MEKFATDQQTLKDLNLLGKYSNSSIFSFYNHTVTHGGEKLLDSFFGSPLLQADQINRRSSLIKQFTSIDSEFPFTAAEIEQWIGYAANYENNNLGVSGMNMIRRKLKKSISNDAEYDTFIQGITVSEQIYQRTLPFFEQLRDKINHPEFSQRLDRSIDFLKKIEGLHLKEPSSLLEAIRFDYLLRHDHYQNIEQLISLLYELDVYLSLGALAKRENFGFAEALDPENNLIEIEAMRHPCLRKAVTNTLKLHAGSNVLFLTGANMAGKSTFMKSFGISLYLAQCGLPIAASSMRFTPQNGLYTSINVPDDIAQGFSHFYAEVRRVKFVAEEVAKENRLVVIFDELFKGTNVKDAYDATVAVTDAFARHNQCSFIVSTHIMEAGIKLQESAHNMQFKYLPTTLENSRPRYTYKLTDGIASDRHGMRIIQNEHILEIIEGKEF